MTDRYFLYRLTWNSERNKYDKQPASLDGQHWPVSAPANLTDRATAEHALAALPVGMYALGMWIAQGSGVFFIDFDDCVDPVTHQLSPDAARIAHPFVAAGAFFESSSSGRGAHIIGRYTGTLPAHCNRRDKFEFYIADRGVALNPAGGVGSMDVDCTAQLLAMLPEAFPPRTTDALPVGQRRPEWRGPEDDDELIRRALAARGSARQAFGHAATFADLWNGNVEKTSEADMALASHLAFWTGCDVERIERLMRRSGLVREKWNEHRTYLRELTIAHACTTTANVYADPQLPTASSLLLESADGIAMEPIHWLWDGWLAAGKLHILAGNAGCGKTTLALSLAAAITTGGKWPDGTTAATGDVLMWSGEDDPATTLVPRLVACGADRRRVKFLKAASDGRPFNPAKDLPLLRAAFENGLHAKLLIVDPIVSVVGSADSHKNAEVRQALEPLVRLAAEFNFAVIGITHLTKGTQGQNPAERITGSLAFGALARVVMIAAKSEASEEQLSSFALARAKSNIGPDWGGFGYTLERVPVGNGVVGQKVLWGDTLGGTTRDVLSSLEGGDKGMDEARDWLEKILTANPIGLSANEIIAAGKSCGFSRDKLGRAKRSLRVKSIKSPDGWIWQLSEIRTDIHAPLPASPEISLNLPKGAQG